MTHWGQAQSWQCWQQSLQQAECNSSTWTTALFPWKGHGHLSARCSMAGAVLWMHPDTPCSLPDELMGRLLLWQFLNNYRGKLLPLNFSLILCSWFLPSLSGCSLAPFFPFYFLREGIGFAHRIFYCLQQNWKNSGGCMSSSSDAVTYFHCQFL